MPAAARSAADESNPIPPARLSKPPNKLRITMPITRGFLTVSVVICRFPFKKIAVHQSAYYKTTNRTNILSHHGSVLIKEVFLWFSGQVFVDVVEHSQREQRAPDHPADTVPSDN